MVATAKFKKVWDPGKCWLNEFRIPGKWWQNVGKMVGK